MNARFTSRLVASQLSALALQRVSPLALVPSLGLLILHAVGLVLVAQLARVPLWIVAAALLVFILAQFLPRIREILSPGLLAPFWFVYFAVGVRFLWLRVFQGEIQGYFEYALPDPRVLLHFEFMIAAAVAYSALILSVQVFPTRARALSVVTVAGLGTVLGWASVEYFGHRTFGATGSDPYAYAQMGIDLATRGTPAHSFALFQLVSATSLSWFPLVHVGYHLPMTQQGEAITVWPLGGAFAFALAYIAGGEAALYLVNPLFSLLSVAISGLLAWELTRRETLTVRIVTASVTAVLVATSNEIVDWAGVTMVDTQALVFSLLALYCALRVYRCGTWRWAVCVGVFWGLAYFVRHTQLVIALAFVPLFLLGDVSGSTKTRNSLAALGAALLIALPDLWYHQIWLGSPLTPESQELALYAVGSIPVALQALGAGALIGAEFGWLMVFLIAGVFFYTRRERIRSLGLLLTLAATLALHLPYPALRLRDLIPLLPLVAFYATCGIVLSVRVLWQKRRRWAIVAAALVLFLALELMLVRVWNTLPRVLVDAAPRFGAMTQAQRSAFDTLAQLTPSNAIVGATLNSGAVELYARRRTVRPNDWTDAELHEFLSIAKSNGYEFFVLQDNAELDRVLMTLSRDYVMERIDTLDVPLFGEDTVTNAGTLWRVK